MLRQPSIYIPHGGGPCFFMDPMPGLPPGYWDRMGAYLRGIAATLPQRPKAALVISAHWEAPQVTIGVAPSHKLLYDYYGFPEHTYHLSYAAPGAPALAARVAELLAEAKIESGQDDQRGIDHGVFIPFKLIFPQADMPIVPLSLRQDLEPHMHFAVGAALAGLRDEGVLIVGSGFSYHNLRHLFHSEPRSDLAALQFDQWLAESVALADPVRREQVLSGWQVAPGALECHPRAEHLLPLMVAAGAGRFDPGWRPYTENLLGKPVCAVQFG
jgi:aromatic ring-opening dioxygenase catalytic subunit (LigB family)